MRVRLDDYKDSSQDKSFNSPSIAKIMKRKQSRIENYLQTRIGGIRMHSLCIHFFFHLIDFYSF